MDTDLELAKWTALLSRSGNRPLALIFNVTSSPALPSPFHLNDQFPKLIEALQRCRELVIMRQGGFNYVITLDAGLSSYPSVSALRLSHFQFATLSSFLDLLQAFPHLRTLTMKDMVIYAIDLASEQRTLHLEHIRILSMGDLHMRGHCRPTYTLLQYLKMPGLKDLTFHDFGGVFAKGIEVSSVTSLSLSFPHYYLSSHPELTELICTMPMLEELKLDVLIKDPLSEVSANMPVPPLVSIDFGDSFNVGELARWLVERTRANRPDGTTSLKTISTQIEKPGACRVRDARWMTEQEVLWIREQGVQVLSI